MRFAISGSNFAINPASCFSASGRERAVLVDFVNLAALVALGASVAAAFDFGFASFFLTIDRAPVRHGLAIRTPECYTHLRSLHAAQHALATATAGLTATAI